MSRFRSRLWRIGITPLLATGLAACSASTVPTTATESSSAAVASAPQASVAAVASTLAFSDEPSAAASTAEATPTTEASSAAEASDTAAATAAATASSAPEATPAAEASSAAVAPIANTKLDLNTVTEDELLSTIPDFGNRMVREFMEYRPYISITQFRQEIGKYVDAEQIALYEQFVYVPIDINEADAATLQQLPGVDAGIAEQLIATRSYDSNATFLAQLAEYVSPADLAAAEGYLAAQ